MTFPNTQAGSVDVAVPLRFDTRGRTAAPSEHVRDMIELLLFTSPGERVNRPDFGSGLLHIVFAPAGPELAATIEYTTHAALQRYLSDVITVNELRVAVDEHILLVDLEYTLLRTGERRQDRFAREVIP
jgi:phage baseplate assembly protein W